MTVNLDLPKQVLEVFEKLGAHGYDVYVYGECVRLLIKGQTLLDFDVITNAKLSRIRAIFDGYNILEDNPDREELVVTVLGVAVSIRTCDAVDDWSAGNAFTVDAIAYNPEKGFTDPFGGLNHINGGVAAFTPNGAKPENVLSALVWCSEEEYTLAPETSKAVFGLIPELSGLSPASLRRDLERVIMGKRAGAVLAEYAEVFFAFIPEFKPLRGYTDFYSRCVKCVGSSSPVLNLRYALLFCELGKPDCYSRDCDDNTHYWGHAERARIYAERIMIRLGCLAEDIKEVGLIIENRDKIPRANDVDIKNLLDEYPFGLLKLLLLFKCAEIRAKNDPRTEHEALNYKHLAGQIT
ncbi:MAG: hypothetical protein LBI36_01130 [Oscillospiraceae bacterium]|jgi:tRNA nucleotidyltransferase (CCA-adding enzyme)|nr:hypothetical protein [Oscillospiraceae bacterium]